jgi:hypothetical protein
MKVNVYFLLEQHMVSFYRLAEGTNRNIIAGCGIFSRLILNCNMNFPTNHFKTEVKNLKKDILTRKVGIANVTHANVANV